MEELELPSKGRMSLHGQVEQPRTKELKLVGELSKDKDGEVLGSFGFKISIILKIFLKTGLMNFFLGITWVEKVPPSFKKVIFFIYTSARKSLNLCGNSKVSFGQLSKS